MKDRRYIFLVPIIVILYNILLMLIINYIENFFLIGTLGMVGYFILGLNIMFYRSLFKRQYSMIVKNLKRFQIINYIGVVLLFVIQIPLIKHFKYIDVDFFIHLLTLPTLFLYLLFPIYMLLQNNINDFTKKISILSIILMTICQLLFIFNAPVIILFIYLTIVIPKMNLE